MNRITILRLIIDAEFLFSFTNCYRIILLIFFYFILLFFGNYIHSVFYFLYDFLLFISYFLSSISYQFSLCFLWSCMNNIPSSVNRRPCDPRLIASCGSFYPMVLIIIFIFFHYWILILIIFWLTIVD